AHLTERQSVMLDSILMTAAMQHAVGRATHDELRTELLGRISAGDVIAEVPMYRLADDRAGSPAKTRSLLQDELHSEKGVPVDAAVRAIDEAIREGRLVQAESRYTTAAAWRTEQSILRTEREGRHRVTPIMN